MSSVEDWFQLKPMQTNTTMPGGGRRRSSSRVRTPVSSLKHKPFLKGCLDSFEENPGLGRLVCGDFLYMHYADQTNQGTPTVSKMTVSKIIGRNQARLTYSNYPDSKGELLSKLSAKRFSRSRERYPVAAVADASPPHTTNVTTSIHVQHSDLESRTLLFIAVCVLFAWYIITP